MKIAKIVLVKIRQLKTEIYTLYLAYRDPRVKWYVKLFLLLVIAYAVSPVDIVPDFIPVLGYLDDLIVLPIGIYLATKMIPSDVREECRRKAQADIKELKLRWIGLALVVLLWLIIVGLVIWLLIRV